MDGNSTASSPARSIFHSSTRAPAPSAATSSRSTGAAVAEPLAKREPQPLVIHRLSPASKGVLVTPAATQPSQVATREPSPIDIQRLTVAPKAAPDTSADARLLAILDSPLAPGETFATGFSRKEAELGNAFAQLTILEARALHARLSINKPGDALADKFSRLTVDRRNRLLTFLAGARRREALAAARR